MIRHHALLRSTLVLLLSGLWLHAFASTAQAGAVSFALTMAEDKNVLLQPASKIVAQNAALKSQHTLMLERTNPYFELRNTSAEDSITQLNITIGDTSKNFDWATMVQASPGVTFSVKSVDAVAGGIKSDLLTIDFTGFKPGDFVRFRAGLSPDVASHSAIMDYRNVFFKMNGNDTSANSLVTVNFQGTDDVVPVSQTMPNFTNSNKFTSTDLALLTTSCGMDSVKPFTLTGSGTDDGGTPPGGPVVPEPSTLAMLCCGLLGLVGWRARRR